MPELDKLVKLSEIFDVSLDELITGKEKAEQPVAQQAEPQVIYIEKPIKPSITPAQILGIVLLFCSALCMVLFACFGERRDLQDVFVLCLPVALWGVICLVTKRPLLWCGWCGSAVWWIYVFVLSAKWEDEIADSIILYRNSLSILVWKNGSFMSIKEAYDQGMLSKEDVAKIAKIHNNDRYVDLNGN